MPLFSSLGAANHISRQPMYKTVHPMTILTNRARESLKKSYNNFQLAAIRAVSTIITISILMTVRVIVDVV